MLKYKTKGNGKRGFTLVELVIVIAVIAILAAVLIPTFTNLIESANNSADTQLVANMNTVLSTDVYANQTATGTNLRKLLKDNGITDLTTRNKDNIIVYNQVKERFEKINLKEVKIQTEEEQKNKSLMADDDSTTLTIDPNPFSFDEIFQGYTIVSTGGNDLSEAIYGFYDFQFADKEIFNVAKPTGWDKFKSLWDKVLNINIGTETENIIAGFRNLVNESVFVMNGGKADDTKYMGVLFAVIDESSNQISDVAGIYTIQPWNGGISSTNFAQGQNWDASSHQTYWDKFTPNSKGREITYESSTSGMGDVIKVTPSRVFISEMSTILFPATFINFDSAVVVIPDTVESVIFPADSASYNLSNIMFLGNTKVLTDAAGTDTSKLRGAQVSSQHIQEIKDSVIKYGAAVAQTEYYVVNSDSPNKNKPHYYTNLDEALKAAKVSADAVNLGREVILASDFTIESGTTINIPANVTLHVPYELSGSGRPKTGQGSNDGTITTLVDDALMDVEGYTHSNNSKGYKQCTLTIESGAELTVEGTLEVGAICCAGITELSATGYIGCVGGNYGQITNKGTITVHPGGRLNAYGYVKCEKEGEIQGTVVVEGGAAVFEPMVVTDSIESEMLMGLIANRKFPYMRYALPNITKLEIKYGGLLSVMKNSIENNSLKSGDGYFVGSDVEKDENGKLIKAGLLTLCKGETENKNGSVTIEYKFEHAVKDGTNAGNNLAGDIGINTVTLNGNVQTGIVMNLAPSLQQEIQSYIPYNFEYIIKGTFNVTNKYVVLPGAKVTVEEGATLCVKKGGEFYITDGYNNDKVEGKETLELDGKSYPKPDLLTKAGLETYGVVTLKNNATFKVENGAHVGGTIQVYEGAKFEIDSGADLSGKFTVGATILEQSNAQTYNLPLQYKLNGEEGEGTPVGTGNTTVSKQQAQDNE